MFYGARKSSFTPRVAHIWISVPSYFVDVSFMHVLLRIV